MSDEIRTLLAKAPTPAEEFRWMALSFRSLCEFNDATTLTVVKTDGHTLTYCMGDGLTLTGPDGERVSHYPETALDDEQWGLADA